jgi:uncharacterized protein (TIGR02391 family)
MILMHAQEFVHLRDEGTGSLAERPISAVRGGDDVLKVGIDEDVEIGDVIEDRLGKHIKRMQVIDVIPQQHGGIMGHFNDHLELRYKVRSLANVEGPRHFDPSSFHPEIAGIAEERLRNGKGNDAVFRAFERIESRIQALTGLTDIGFDLMTAVFRDDAQSTRLDVAGDDLDTEKRRTSERAGYKFIFYGVMQGVRNLHGHGSRPEISTVEAFELLALASHLMRRLDLAESRLPT